VVPEDEMILVSSNKGAPLTMDNQKTPAAEAFRNIARRITGEKVPIMKFDQQGGGGGFLKRFARMFGSSDK
jgi:septum site-determining protein MinD